MKLNEKLNLWNIENAMSLEVLCDTLLQREEARVVDIDIIDDYNFDELYLDWIIE